MEGKENLKFIDGIHAKLSQKETLPKKHFRPQFLSYLGIFVVLFLLLFSAVELYLSAHSLENIILVHAKSGEGHLESAQGAFADKDLNLALLEFEKAETEFKLADSVLEKAGQKSLYLTHFTKTKNKVFEGQKLLNSATQISSLGQKIISEFDPLFNLESSEDLDFFEKINFISNTLSESLQILKKSKNQIGDVSFIETQSLLEKISKAQDSIELFEKTLHLFPEISGQKETKKYLILFQNPAEARPAGGFLGNYGLLTLNSGKVEDLVINDIYALKWDYLNGKYLDFPSYTPLSFFCSKFGIQEGNWSVDFPTTAIRMEELFVKYGGEKPDGVIAVDPKLFEDILQILGTIEMEDYDVVLNHKNFWEKIQHKVEVDNDFKRGNLTVNPKKILQDFSPIFLEKISKASPEDKIKIFSKLFENLSQKHILLYSENDQVQNLISVLNWSGEIKDSSRDFLLIANSNISATKSSLKIKEKINLIVNILSDGTIVNEVGVSHDGKDLAGLLADSDRSFIQALVPQGSELIGMEYDNKDIPKDKIYQFSENSKKSFSYDNFSVLPREKKEIIFRYKLPFKITKDSEFYSLLVQKQAGTLANELSIEINLADNFKIKNYTPADLEISSGNIKYLTNLENDKFLRLIFDFQN